MQSAIPPPRAGRHNIVDENHPVFLIIVTKIIAYSLSWTFMSPDALFTSDCLLITGGFIYFAPSYCFLCQDLESVWHNFAFLMVLTLPSRR